MGYNREEDPIIGKREFNLKTGDQVLVIDKTYIIKDSTCGGSLIEFHPMEWTTKLILGVLNKDFKETLSKDTKLFINLPTKEYLEQTHPSSYTSYRSEEIRKWRHKDGNLIIKPGHNISHVSYYMSHTNKIDLNKKPKRGEIKFDYHGTFILAGNEVPDYFSSYDEDNIFLKKNKIDLSYVIAMNILKQEIPSSHKETFEKELEKRAYYIYKSIQKLEGIVGGSEEEIEYARRISELPKTEDSTIEGDKVLFALSNYEKMQEVGYKKGSIKDLITEALLLGLNKRDFKIELRPGMTLNFPAYING